MIRNTTIHCLCMLTLAAGGALAHADVINIVASNDNSLYESATGALSNGAGPTFFVGRTNAGVLRRGLLRFDLSGVPAGATINLVTLSLNMSMTSAGAVNVSAFRLASDWGEGTSDAGASGGMGAASTIGDATWIHTFFNASSWNTAGGDFAALASATTSVGAVGGYTWTSAQMLADVQGWIASPSSNFGWMLLGDEVNNNTTKRFDTRENATAANRPTLNIDYTPVPAPATMLVLLCGALIGQRGRLRRGQRARTLGERQ